MPHATTMGVRRDTTSVDESTVVSALVATLASHDHLRIRNACMLGILFDCGIKMGELVALNVNDVDRDSCMLSVRSGHGTVRTILFRGHTAALIDKHLANRRHNLPNALFLNHGNTRLTRQGATVVLAEYYQEVGLVHLTQQRLRAAFTRRLRTNGLQWEEIRVQLGLCSVQRIKLRYAD